jgi:hypothetical protein
VEGALLLYIPKRKLGASLKSILGARFNNREYGRFLQRDLNTYVLHIAMVPDLFMNY